MTAMTTTLAPPGRLSPVVDLPDPFASLPRRVVAALLDTAILSAAAFLLADGPVGRLPGWVVGVGWGDARPLSGGAVLALGLLLALQAWTGATPGKRVVGIVVVRERDGRPLGPVLTVLRQVAHVLDAIVLIGYLRPLWHDRRRTWADSVVASDVLLDHVHRSTRGLATERLWVTSGAWVVCGAALLLSVPGSRGWGGESHPCEVPAGAGPLRGVAGVERVALDLPPRTEETRLGLSRATSHEAATVAWTLASPAPPDGTVLVSTVHDEHGVVTFEDRLTVRDGGVVDAEGAPASLVRTVPWDAFGPFPPTWGWRAEVVADGRATEVCSLGWGVG